jgi:hypothetical protein
MSIGLQHHHQLRIHTLTLNPNIIGSSNQTNADMLTAATTTTSTADSSM